MIRPFMFGVVVFDPVDARISADRDEYARWSVRAKLRMLAAVPRPGPARKPDRFRSYTYANAAHARGQWERRERIVRRAVLGAWARAYRSEMRGLRDDMADALRYTFSYAFVVPLTWRQRVARAWAAARAAYQVRTEEWTPQPGPLAPPVPPRDRRVE